MMTPKKLIVCFVAFSLLTGAAFNQTQSATPRLSGIVNLSDMKRAVLEMPSDGSHRSASSLILSERQREGQIEVVQIVPGTLSVEVRTFPDTNSLALTFRNDAGKAMTNDFLLVFEAASLEPVLHLYSELSQRTLLRWPKLPEIPLSIVAQAGDRKAAALAIQSALNEKGLATIPDGEKFMMVVPQERVASVKPRSSEIKPSGAVEPEMIPAGMIDWRGLPIEQAILIYPELRQRKLDASVPMPPAKYGRLHFRTQTALTRPEAIYAVETLLGWAGIKMVSVGDDQMKAVQAGGEDSEK